MTDTNHIDASIIREAAEVLQAVANSSAALPSSWRWPLLDELHGIAAALSARASAGEGGEYVLVPRVPTAKMLACIARSEWPQDWESGKRLQREAGCEVVFPKTEIECAVGQYQRMLTAAPQPAAADGEPSRFFASGPQGEFFTDNWYLADVLISKAYDRDDWTITDLAAAPQPQEVETKPGDSLVPCPTCGAQTNRSERGGIESYGDTRHYEYTYMPPNPTAPQPQEKQREPCYCRRCHPTSRHWHLSHGH